MIAKSIDQNWIDQKTRQLCLADVFRDRHLSRLCQKLYDDGHGSLGNVIDIGESELKRRYRVSNSTIERVRREVSAFGATLRP